MNSKEKQPIIVSDKGNSKHTFLNERTILKLLIGACMVIAPLLFAVQIMSGGFSKLETTKEGDKMFLTKTESEPNRTMPPVDAYAPAGTETATFALG
jgi:hypothetical protein